VTKLHISDTLSLPLDFVTSTSAILAKKRSGKTYLAQKIAEGMLAAKQQVVVIDLTSAWWGLRSSADGASPGYPITIFGGKHGDLPLEATSGELLAEAIVADRFSAVLDVRLLKKGARIRFIADFLEALYDKNTEAMHLFMDEADAYIPQRSFSPEEARALGAADELVRRGGIGGIGVTMISQRAQVLNKNVLSQVDTLAVLRMNHPKDIDATEDWLSNHAEPKLIKEILASLSSLPVGEAWFLDPEHKTFQRITVARKETYDSGRTPKVGEHVTPPKVLAKVDLDRLGESIRETVERAKANDPKALRARIAELEKQPGGKPGTVTERVVEKIVHVDRPILSDVEIRRLEAAVKIFTAAFDRFECESNQIAEEITTVGGVMRDFEAAIHLSGQLPPRIILAAPETASPRQPKAKRAPKQADASTAPEIIPAQPRPAPSETTVEQRQAILDALATLKAIELPASVKTLAAWLGVHPRTKALLTNIGVLRSEGLIEDLDLTDVGRAAAHVQPHNPDQRRAAFTSALSELQIRILDTIASLDDLDRSKSHATLSAWLGAHPRTKAILEDLGGLRSKGFLNDNDLTALGRHAATPRFTEKTVADILEPLEESQQRIAATVIRRGGVNNITDLAAILGVHPRTKALLTDLGLLRSRGMLTIGWPIKPTDVFPQDGAQ